MQIHNSRPYVKPDWLTDEDAPQHVAEVQRIVAVALDKRHFNKSHLQALIHPDLTPRQLARIFGKSAKTFANARSELRRAGYIEQIGPVLPFIELPAVDQDDRLAVWQKTQGRCHYCNVETTYERGYSHSFTVDHVLAVARGGTNDMGNLVPCCARCNASKGARIAADFSGERP